MKLFYTSLSYINLPRKTPTLVGNEYFNTGIKNGKLHAFDLNEITRHYVIPEVKHLNNREQKIDC